MKNWIGFLFVFLLIGSCLNIMPFMNEEEGTITMTKLSYSQVLSSLRYNPGATTLIVKIKDGGGGDFWQGRDIIRLTQHMEARCEGTCSSTSAFVVICREEWVNLGLLKFHEPYLAKNLQPSLPARKFLEEYCPVLPDMSRTSVGVMLEIRGNDLSKGWLN